MTRIKFLLFGLCFWFLSFNFLSFPSYAQTTDLSALVQQLQRQIEELNKKIYVLQQQLQETRQELGTSPAPVSGFQPTTQPISVETEEESVPQFTKSLFRGSSGEEVRKLQEHLAKDKEIYPEGLVTGYFGPKTEEALKRWQIKHKIEAVGILGPQTRAKFQELGKERIKEFPEEGAPTAVGGVIPPGLLIAPGIQKKIDVAIPTSVGIGTPTSTQSNVEATTTPPITPPPSNSCAANVNYCYNSNICSENGWYWCRNSCYSTKDACLGQTYVAPAQATTAATPAIPAVPAQPTSQTSTTTVPATPAVPAIPATPVATSTVPSIPQVQGFTATVSGTSVNLSWQDVTSSTYNLAGSPNNMFGSYNIYRGSSADFTPSPIPSNPTNMIVQGSVLSYTDSNLAAGTYYYKITLQDKNGVVGPASQAVSATIVAVPQSTGPATNGLISHWKFDGNGENEISGASAAITVGNAAFNPSGGKLGGYLYIPNQSDYVKIPYNSMYDLQNFTIEFWFRQRSNQSINQNFIYKGAPTNNYNFNVFRNLWNEFNNGPVKAGATVASNGYWHHVSNPNEPPHNVWHHIVFTKTPNIDMAYYIDGNKIHSQNYSDSYDSQYAGPVKTPAVDIIIGNPLIDTDIDNVKIYNRPITASEVLQNYNASTASNKKPDSYLASTLQSLNSIISSLEKLLRNWQ